MRRRLRAWMRWLFGPLALAVMVAGLLTPAAGPAPDAYASSSVTWTDISVDVPGYQQVGTQVVGQAGSTTISQLYYAIQTQKVSRAYLEATCLLIHADFFPPGSPYPSIQLPGGFPGVYPPVFAPTATDEGPPFYWGSDAFARVNRSMGQSGILTIFWGVYPDNDGTCESPAYDSGYDEFLIGNGGIIP